MKVVAISDLHGHLPDIPECDVLCICGDTFPIEAQDDQVMSTGWFYLEFIPWVESLPCKKVLLIAGNHDFILYQNNLTIAKRKLFDRLTFYYESDKLVYLLDELYEF
jgi:predicted phosphodiesterase